MDSQELSNRTDADSQALGTLGKIYDGLSFTKTGSISKSLGNSLQLASSNFSNWFNSEAYNLKKRIFNENMNELKEKIDAIPEEMVCEVHPEVGVPIIEKLSYVTNEGIKKAYMNLLTKASSKETFNLAHPSFEGIIGRLSADEVRIIEFLKGKSELKFLQYQLETSKNLETKESKLFYRKRFATGIEFEVELEFANNIEAYTFNLMAIGIFSHTTGMLEPVDYFNLLRDTYEVYEECLNEKIKSSQENPFLDHLIELLPTLRDDEEIMVTHEQIRAEAQFQSESQFSHITVEQGCFDITPFGMLFIKACTDS